MAQRATVRELSEVALHTHAWLMRACAAPIQPARLRSRGSAALQTAAHERLAIGALERLGLGVRIAALHFFLLGLLGHWRGSGRRHAFTLQAGAHEGLALIAFLALTPR